MIPLRSLFVVALAALVLAPAAAFGQSYRNYTQIAQLMSDAATNYPAICRLVNLGTSYQGRVIWALNISDNVGTEEDEPEMKYISTMHGNEWTGNEMMLYLIDELLSNYGTDPEITNLVNEMDIWIVPLMNPDGFVLDQRYNARGVDLNRDFPDWDDDPINTPAGREAETGVIMNWVANESFTLSANFHTGTMVCNYPYDNNPQGTSTYTISPDDDLFIHICTLYAQSNLPMWNSSEFLHGITNGADWYTVSGGMQDWNYRWYGCNEVTIELSDSFQPPASQIPTFWSNNRDSLIAYMSTALIGVRGIVTDAVTGDPLAATISVGGIDHDVYTDPDIGDYHRMLLPGTYNITVSAPSYPTRTFYNVAVASGPATRLDVALQPPPAIAPDALPDGNVLAPYGPIALSVTGGTAPLNWSATVPGYVETDLGTNAFAATGVAQNWKGDDIFKNYTLPFPFPFYGVSYTTIQVWSNGFINFGAITGSSANNTNADLIANHRIAPLWDDLKTNVTGKDIYVDESLSDRVTIRWDAVTYAGNHQVDVALTLFDDGRIQFHYGNSNTPVSPTIGISNGDGIAYTLAAYNGATALTNVNSLQFAPIPVLPPGLTLSPSGVLAGTPTQAGAYNFIVEVIDNDGRSDTHTFNLTVNPPNADGDYNGDGRIDLADYAAFQACNGTTPAGACGSAFDYIPNGMIDLEDFAVFTGQLTGPAN
ncbi:MAG TPA: M14 family zinc carboxypeptidase [Phycisphaerae bacterium]|nr:carboxypeptidase regulatory-like domain-containing protein [Phycisphaerales bacterium]HRX86978.1 M14 family zinc carboxypeptidase [Phycisphaerae bacterium]